MLECYQAYADYQVMATLTRELTQECCAALFGDHVARHHDGSEIDLSGQWRQVPLYDLVSDAVGEPVTPETPIEKLRALAERHEIGVDPAWVAGKVVEEIFESLVQHTLQAPTFVMDYPVDTSPLTRAHRSAPGLAEKWDLYIAGVERATAYSELVDPVVQRERLTALAERHDVGVDPAWLPGKVVEELFEALVQDSLQEPTFVLDYPVDTSPLTRAHRSVPGLAEKWDLYIGGVERGTGYSELVDPVVQRERFTQQALLAAAGDPEAMVLDEDFLEALEYGMPPTGGMGMGMDRLLMTLTGLGIRETILFPLVRPISHS